MKTKFIGMGITLVAVIFLYFQGKDAASANNPGNPGNPQTQSTDKGVGPFQNVTLAPIDNEKVKAGANIFNNKCFICHELDNVKIGPPLRNVTKENTPEFVLNMIVNPTGMQQNNETIKALMKKFNNIPMTDQQISQEDALKIYDYLRSVAK